MSRHHLHLLKQLLMAYHAVQAQPVAVMIKPVRQQPAVAGRPFRVHYLAESRDSRAAARYANAVHTRYRSVVSSTVTHVAGRRAQQCVTTVAPLAHDPRLKYIR